MVIHYPAQPSTRLSGESNCTSCFSSRTEDTTGAKGELSLLLSRGGGREGGKRVSLELNPEKCSLFSYKDVMGKEDWSVLELASSYGRETEASDIAGSHTKGFLRDPKQFGFSYSY